MARSVSPAEGGLPAPTMAARRSRTDTTQHGHLLGRNGSRGGQRLEADLVVQVLRGRGDPASGQASGPQAAGRDPGARQVHSQPGGLS